MERWARLGRVDRRRLDGSYDEYRFSHPVETAIANLSNKSWVSAPVSTGVAQRLVYHPELQARLDWADVVIVEHPWQFAGCRRLKPQARFVFASHNMEADKITSFAHSNRHPFGWQAWKRHIERMEREACRQADLVYTVSELDRAESAKRYGVELEKILAVPNSTDCAEIRPVSEAERRAAGQRLGLPLKPVAVFAQGAAPSAGMPAFHWVEKLAAANDRVHFVMAGALFSGREQRKNLTITGPIVDIRPYIIAADFGICPIEFGAGTKTKLIEALGAGLPTVAFEHSLHGFDLLPEEHLLVAETSVESLSAAFDRLLDEPGLAARLSAAGRAYVEANHDWDVHVERLDRALRRLVDGG